MRVRASRLLLLSVAFLAGAGGVQLAVAPASRAARAAAPRCSATQPSEAAVVTAAAAGAKAMEQARAAAEAAVSPPAAASKRKGAQTFGKPLVIGLSHKTATVEVREKLSIPEAQWNEAAAALVGYETVQEAAILSTCNRFEVYIVAEDHYAATRDVLSFLRGHSGLEAETLRPNLFMLQDEEATLHLLRVSSGLDSLVATKKLKSLDPKQRQAVEVLTKGIINKLLHAPMTYLRSDDADGTKATVDQINALFQTGDRADDNRRGGRR
ncbi:hypothetical protein EMIHUDRAFT_456638 [Emiliania huxleyi CCMP1516]|uniref:Glutamyl-tRNA reductase N-terminal domain-containing protein n=2 Tax=Emiliania huxleyi TaxID=2903 RepID=A0A0D3K3G1_EMIH1|nr:hypothetical protein EMIHUDRAFT_456638 [Emiliania huxleyi CCMP1516]EOD30296.1 hypothetical protein EMIHUDRAFT_456638 [Emiliania huxleyi CCMP1516]|eukprot:XP_005782725.1 hypothetical protein EMIHUDRAFT_456638 [Emiliania huxleyi CCMP1516]